MGKKFCAGGAMAAAMVLLALCGCSGKKSDSAETEIFSVESGGADGIFEETEAGGRGNPDNSGNFPNNLVLLETFIMEASDKPGSYSVRTVAFDDFDGDGKNELYAVYGSEEKNSSDAYLTAARNSAYGELWFADDDGAVLLYSEYEWLLNSPVIDLGDMIILHADRGSDGRSFYFNMLEDRPWQMGTYQLKYITYIGNRDFIGYFLSYEGGDYEDALKPYWFYIPEGGSYSIWEYRGREITAEEFSWYKGSQEVLDDISQEQGSEIIRILYRENGIININYKAWERGSLFRTLEILEDGSLNDITPEENQWWYIPAVSYVIDPY